MEYYSENDAGSFDFSACELLSAERRGNDLVLCVKNACALKSAPQNTFGADVCIPEMKLILAGFSLKLITALKRSFLLPGESKPCVIGERRLYKSEYPAFEERLCTLRADIFSFLVRDNTVQAELCFTDTDSAGMGDYYTLSAEICGLTAVWDKFGSVRQKKRQTLAERADMLKREIPAVFIALSHSRTPRLAKIISAAAVGYALSPIDLVPDFIPLLGYLDDVLILPGLIYLAIRLIPDEVMDECRSRADRLFAEKHPRKWIYALPIALFWAVVIILAVRQIAAAV